MYDRTVSVYGQGNGEHVLRNIVYCVKVSMIGKPEVVLEHCTYFVHIYRSKIPTNL